MIKLAGVALQASRDLAQTLRTGKLRIQHRNQVTLRRQCACVMVGFMFIHKTVDDVPGNLLQERMKNDILMPHGFGSFSCPFDSQPSGNE